MHLHKRFLQAATAALYMGPLLAGLGGFGWAMLPPFVSIFVFWLVLTRPHQWPQTNAEWLSPQAWLAALAQILSQVVLVAVLFGIGRGIGGVLGFIPALPEILPFALSFTAVPLMRLVWKGEEALKAGVTVDDVLHDPAPALEDRADLMATIQRVDTLLAADADTPSADLRAQLDTVIAAPNGWAAIAVMAQDMAAAPVAQHHALRRALIDWSTDPNNLSAWASAGAIRAAFNAAGLDSALLNQLLPRARFLLQARPTSAPQFPDPAVLEDAALRTDDDKTATALRDLADVLRAARDLAEMRHGITAIPRAAQHGWRDRPVAATA